MQKQTRPGRVAVLSGLITSLDPGCQPLKDYFNANRQRLRLLAVVSPT